MPKDQLKRRLERSVTVSDELWDKVSRNVTLISLKKGQTVVPYGAVNRFAFFLASGSCICSQASTSGKTRVVWFYFDDLFEFFSTPDSYFEQEPTKYEIKALQDAEVIKIHRDTIEELTGTDREFSKFVIEQIMFDFMAVFEARSCLLTFTSAEFLAYTKKKYPLIFERMPDKYLADLMGVSAEWYSKLKKNAGLG